MLLFTKMREKLHDIAACAVREKVYIFFLRIDLFILLLIVFFKERDGFPDICARCVKLGQQEIITAVQGEGRCRKENRVETIELFLIRILRNRFILHDTAAYFLVGSKQREQSDRACQVKNRIRIRDDAGVHGLVPERIQNSALMKDRDYGKDQNRFAQIKQNVNDADALRICLCTDRADDCGRDAVTEINADDHRVHRVEGQNPRRGKGLENTNCCAGALQNKGNAGTGCIAKQGIGVKP